eukprot:m.431939 g.431939  ORF g.431939 m.431939 type:complete len:60 (-) comp17369_c0_seq1:1170-1349(-)
MCCRSLNESQILPCIGSTYIAAREGYGRMNLIGREQKKLTSGILELQVADALTSFVTSQ